MESPNQLTQNRLTIPDYFSFLNGLLIFLFLATLVMIFVYEYDSLRRDRGQT